MEIDFLKLILLTAIHDTPEEQRHSFLSQLRSFIEFEMKRCSSPVSSIEEFDSKYKWEY